MATDERPLNTGSVAPDDEAVITLTEWGSSDAGVALSAADEETLDAEINAEKTQLSYSYDRDGQATFHARQFVGSVALPDGPTIHIQPKAAGTNLGYLLRYAQGVTPTTIEQPLGLAVGESFVDALAALFNQELESILRQGLHTQYQTKRQAESQLRGRLDVQRQLQRQGPVPTAFECTYDELTPDTTANQAILYGTVVLSRLVADADLQQELEWHAAQLRDAVTLRPVRAAELEQIEVNRLNEYYADILRLVEPVLRNLHIDTLEMGQRQSFSLLVNMNTVYERVIDRAVSAVADRTSGWDAASQAHTTNLIRGTPTVNMYPDFAITAADDPDETLVVGDAKWKTGGVANDDIYQLTSYVLARDAPGVVFYPAQDGAAERSYTIDQEWPLEIVEIPTDAQAPDFESFVNALETAVERALTEVRD
jgi:5-methylcytosine-specific restriction enzyme subunit McrC